MIPPLSRDKLWEAFRRMLLIRRFEEACITTWHEGNIPGHYHVYIGQEATGAGVDAALEPGDYLFSTHRNHGHILARGADPGKAMAEIMGKATGYAKGKAGTLHGTAPEVNVLTSSAIVGGNIPISVGTAYALQRQNKPNVSVMMFGDGSMEEGAFYEAINLASLWKFPVLFVCENNGWGISSVPGQPTYHSSNLAAHQLTDIAGALQVPTVAVDGLDLGAVYQATKEARDQALAGGGPTFLEMRTPQWPGGQWPELVTGITDIRRAWSGRVPRQYARLRNWFVRDDPVLRLARELTRAGVFTRRRIDALDAEVHEQMDKALTFALESPFPALEEALTDVWPSLGTQKTER